MSRQQAAVVLGASGSVGNALIAELFRDGSFDPVITLSRRSIPAIVSIFRPAMIVGSQHTPWLLEKILPLFSLVTPGKYKSITVTQIAQAMIAAAKEHPATSAVYHYHEMMALIDRSV